MLSHTWLTDNDEGVTFEDFGHEKAKRKTRGYNKIIFCGEQAARDGLQYFWAVWFWIMQISKHKIS